MNQENNITVERQELENNILFKKLMLKNQEILQKYYLNFLQKKDIEFERYYEFYAFKSFKELLRCVSTIEQMEYIPLFLSKYPRPKFYSQNGIDEVRYYKYHLETHYHKYCTLYDQFLSLTSRIYDLGLPGKNIRLDILTQNTHTSESPAVKLLITFNKEIQKIRAVRNLSAHEGVFKDEEIDELHMYKFVTGVEPNLWQEHLPQELLDGAIKETIDERIELIQERNTFAMLNLNNLLIALDSQFEIIKRRYQS